MLEAWCSPSIDFLVWGTISEKILLVLQIHNTVFSVLLDYTYIKQKGHKKERFFILPFQHEIRSFHKNKGKYQKRIKRPFASLFSYVFSFLPNTFSPRYPPDSSLGWLPAQNSESNETVNIFFSGLWQRSMARSFRRKLKERFQFTGQWINE